MTAPVELQLAPSAGAPTPPTLARERYGGASAQSQANFLAVARRDDRRGRGRDHLRHRRVIDRARGFGLDSAVEGFASTIIIWRFTGPRVFSKRAEHRAQKLVAIQFFMLAPYVGVESIRALVGGEHADGSVVGMVLAGWGLATPTRSAPPPPRARAARTLDPVVGLLIGGVAVKEGAEARRREGCRVGSLLDGHAVPRDACADDCCSDD